MADCSRCNVQGHRLLWPDLIYLPEVPFSIDDFIKRIKELAKNKK